MWISQPFLDFSTTKTGRFGSSFHPLDSFLKRAVPRMLMGPTPRKKTWDGKKPNPKSLGFWVYHIIISTNFCRILCTNSTWYSNVAIMGVSMLNFIIFLPWICKGWIPGALAVDETEMSMFLFLISWQVASIIFPQDKNPMPINIPFRKEKN